jgi:hypothetical protein
MLGTHLAGCDLTKAEVDMEPVTTLAATVIGILTPYVAKGTEEFVKVAGKEAYEKTKQLFSTLKKKWSGDEEASQALVRFEEKPNRYEQVLKNILQEKLETNNDFADEISRQVDAIGSQIYVIQKMKEAKRVTGADIEEMEGGQVKVEQDFDKGEDINGVKIKHLTK